MMLIIYLIFVKMNNYHKSQTIPMRPVSQLSLAKDDDLEY